MPELPQELSPAQREIMEIVWERGEVSARDVRLALAETRDLARNTIRTMLERMEAKGWLLHRQEGRTFIYYAALQRETTIGEKVREVVDNVCGGSAETLVNALLNHRGLSRAELGRIRKLLDEAKATRKKQPKKRNNEQRGEE